MGRYGQTLTFCIATATVAIATSSSVHAQDFPNRLVTFVVPQSPGGTTDVVGRALAGKLSEKWGQSVVVENIVGASGAIGTQQVALADPDGYTLLFTYEGSQAINPHVLDSQGFDAVDDFTPIATVARAGFMVVSRPDFQAADFAEFLALAGDEPDVLTYGSAGSGSANHLIGEMINDGADVLIRHVPYRGVSQALTEVLGGQIDSAVASIPSLVGQLQSGALRALAVTSAERSSALPDVPTIAESGVPGFDIAPWWGVLGPSRMDPALVATIAQDVNEVLEDEDLKATLQNLGAEPFVSSSEDFSALLAADIEKWGEIVSTVDIER